MPTPPPPPPPNRGRTSDPDPETPQGTGTTDTTDTPPRGRATSQGRATRPPTTPKLQRRLEEFFVAPAAVYAATGHHYPAQIIALRSPQLAEDLYQLAQESLAVKRVLEKLLEGGAWGGVIVSAASILIPVLSYHNVVPIGDPFSAFLPAPQVDTRRPIVPPPPGPGNAATTDTNGGGGASGYTPPIADGEPPGVVTVAGTGAVLS
jgi:hypothetical protein